MTAMKQNILLAALICLMCVLAVAIALPFAYSSGPETKQTDTHYTLVRYCDHCDYGQDVYVPKGIHVKSYRFVCKRCNVLSFAQHGSYPKRMVVIEGDKY